MTLGAVAVDAGDLPLGGGLLALLRPALAGTEPGGVVALLSTSRAVAEDLPSFCRAERHEYLGAEALPDGQTRHLVRRGPFSVPKHAREAPLSLARGPMTAAAMLAAVPMPDAATPDSAFAPRGAQVEPGGPTYPFTLVKRDVVAPPEIATLYDQAVAAQWNAATDIPWDELLELDPRVERAVGQIMTFLAENELAALYVPARFLPRIHPAFVETSMFLATQLADEARHAHVYLARARAQGGGLGTSAAVTGYSLRGLLEPDDFVESTFLLSVLGEGTFLDLLRFVETHAPDRCTQEIARRTRLDEARHVHFGLAHVRHALAHDPTVFARLEAATLRRAASLPSTASAPAPLADALVLLAAGSVEPAKVARGHEAYRALLDEMHEARRKRLVHAGFDEAQADRLSLLHTPNFM